MLSIVRSTVLIFIRENVDTPNRCLAGSKKGRRTETGIWLCWKEELAKGYYGLNVKCSHRQTCFTSWFVAGGSILEGSRTTLGSVMLRFSSLASLPFSALLPDLQRCELAEAGISHCSKDVGHHAFPATKDSILQASNQNKPLLY